MRRLVRDSAGVVRFKANPIVRWLIDEAIADRARDLNAIAAQKFPRWARREIYQLIGYSVTGYAEVFTTGAPTDRAWEAMERLAP